MRSILNEYTVYEPPCSNDVLVYKNLEYFTAVPVYFLFEMQHVKMLSFYYHRSPLTYSYPRRTTEEAHHLHGEVSALIYTVVGTNCCKGEEVFTRGRSNGSTEGEMIGESGDKKERRRQVSLPRE